MAKKAKASPVEHASTEEAIAAIEKMTDIENGRLRWYADAMALHLQGNGLGVGSDDLIQEAMSRTVTGTRKWAKHVSITKHLIGVVRSAASHIRRGSLTLVTAEEDRNSDEWFSSFGVPPSIPTPEDRTIAKQLLEQIQQRFKDDTEVVFVLEEMAKGKQGPDIRDALGINQTELETIMTRLRRGARPLKKVQ
jgi:DNA-directed RNA polymerase specialized sigma24 family protein